MPFHRDHKHLNKFGCRGTDYQKVLNAITTCIIKSIKQNHQAAISRQSHLEKALNPHANFSLVPKAHWLVPFGRNKNFIGRHSQLEEVFARLDPEVSDDDCQRVAIAGLGGVGKTQIALEAAFQIQKASPNRSVF